MLRPFRLHEPTSVNDAVSLLGQFGDEAKAYSGGTELLLAMKEGMLRYSHLVNVKTVSGLDELSYDAENGLLSIGSAVTHRAVELSAQVHDRFPLIAEAESKVANVRVRNVGTIGGNLCFAEPHSDPATFLLLYDSLVETQGSRGQRTFPLADLTLGPFETCLEEDELLTRVLVPQFPSGMTGSYLKFGYHARPSLGIGVAVRLDPALPEDAEVEQATVREARVAVGSAGPKAVRVAEAEDLLTGKSVAELLRAESLLLNEAGQLAAQAADAMDDIHGSAEYKEHMLAVFFRRAFVRAAYCSHNQANPS